MAASQQITVGTTATSITVPSGQPRGWAVEMVVENHDAAKDMYLGGSDVTTSNGLLLAPKASLSLRMDSDDTLYAVGPSARPWPGLPPRAPAVGMGQRGVD
jgi:hypothetical protein